MNLRTVNANQYLDLLTQWFLITVRFVKWIVIICVICTGTIAQNTQSDMSLNMDMALSKAAVVPPSAEPTAFAQYGEYAVNKYTGTPSIQIPVCGMKGKEIGVSFDLSYNAGGIRVADGPTMVGSGWNLGGNFMISRVVNGRPDLKDNYFNFADSITNGIIIPAQPSPNDLDFLREVSKGVIETQPDQFYFNFNGRNGKFYIDPYKEVYLREYNDLIIDVDFDPSNDDIVSFTITDEYGTKYLFNITEETEITYDEVTSASDPTLATTEDIVQYNSTWKLANITSRDGKEKILYTYTNDTDDFDVPINFSQYQGFSYQDCFDGSGPPSTSSTTSNGGPSSVSKILNRQILTSSICLLNNIPVEKVEFTTSDVTCTHAFDGDVQLDKVQYFRKDMTNAAKQWDFTYDCSVGRLTLIALEELPVSGSGSIPPYSFVYQSGTLPDFNSEAVDHWGFYNGNSGNLLPIYNTTTGELNDTNRDPNESLMKTGTLQSINYPTGGTTIFNFEAHTYCVSNTVTNDIPFTYGNSNLSPAFMESCDEFGFGCCMILDGDTDVSQFTQNILVNQEMIDDAFLIVRAEEVSCPIPTNPNLGIYGTVEIVDATDPTISYGSFQVSLGLEKIKFSDHFSPPVGNHMIILKGLSTRIWIDEWTVPQTTNVFQNKTVGGLRIESITSLDSDNNQLLKKEYAYHQNSASCSSGNLFGDPNYLQLGMYHYHFVPFFGGGGPPESMCFSSRVLANSRSDLGTVQGSHIGYSRVEELVIRDFNTLAIAGKSVDYFHNQNFNQYSRDPVFNGKVIKKEYFHENGNILSRKEYQYSFDDDSDHRGELFFGYTVQMDPNQDNLDHLYIDDMGNYIWTQNLDIAQSNDYQGSWITNLSRSDIRLLEQHFVYPTQEKETLFYYDQNEAYASEVSNTLNFFFDDPDHLQMTSRSQINSDGKEYLDLYRYMNEYESGLDPDAISSVGDALLAQNKLLPAWRTERYIGTESPTNLLDGSKTIYDNFNLTLYPATLYRYEYDLITPSPSAINGWKVQVEYNDYNFQGNITDFRLDGWDDSYVIGYSSTGKISNSSFINFTTTYSYDAFDLLSSKVNIDGTQQTYIYDGLLRLTSAKDECRNVTVSYDYHYKDQSIAGIGGTSSLNFTKITTDYPLTTGSALDELENYFYLDDIGRPVQTVLRNQSGAPNTDQIISTAYDDAGRVHRQYEQIGAPTMMENTILH